MLLLVASLITWSGSLLLQILSTLDTLAELTGARESAAAARAAATAATNAATDALNRFTARLIATLLAAVPHLLGTLALFVTYLVWKRKRAARLRAEYLAQQTRRYVTEDGWLTLRLKQPLEPYLPLSTLLLPPSENPDAQQKALLDEFDSLRERAYALSVPTDGDEADGGVAERRQVLGRYCLLAASAAASPPCSVYERLAARGISFTWGDAWKWEGEYDARSPEEWEEHASTVTTITKSPISSEGLPLHTECDATFEAACSAYNLGASLSSLSLHQNLDQRMASLQQAAGAIAAVADLVAASDWLGRATADLRQDALSSFTAVLLAQAQRCVYEKALERGLTPSSMEAIAAEASALYADAHKAVKTAIGDKDASLRDPLAAEWCKVPECLSLLFEALAHSHAAQVHANNLEYGKQVARLAHAVKQVEAAQKKAPSHVQDYMETHKVSLTNTYERAVKDNDTIYFESVPKGVSSLPSLKRPQQKMVKPQAPTELTPQGAAASPGWSSPLRALFGSPLVGR